MFTSASPRLVTLTSTSTSTSQQTADEGASWPRRGVALEGIADLPYQDRPPDADLLRYVREMTYALAVSSRSGDEWAHAIGTELACMRAVWGHGGGALTGDLAARSLRFTAALSVPGPRPSARAAAPT
jgi:hypothetical protein